MTSNYSQQAHNYIDSIETGVTRFIHENYSGDQSVLLKTTTKFNVEVLGKNTLNKEVLALDLTPV